MAPSCIFHFSFFSLSKVVQDSQKGSCSSTFYLNCLDQNVWRKKRMYNGIEAKINEKFLFDGEQGKKTKKKQTALSCHTKMASLTFSGCKREILWLHVVFYLHVTLRNIVMFQTGCSPNCFTTIRHAGCG